MSATIENLTASQIKALNDEHDRLNQRISDVRARQREVNQRIDELALSLKPQFPTQAQVDGLAEAVRRIQAGEQPSTHHGDPTPTYDVVVNGARGWLHVRHGAPRSRSRMGYHLWQFADTDVEAFIAGLGDLGMQVTSWWFSDGGVSIEVRTA